MAPALRSLLAAAAAAAPALLSSGGGWPGILVEASEQASEQAGKPPKYSVAGNCGENGDSCDGEEVGLLAMRRQPLDPSMDPGAIPAAFLRSSADQAIACLEVNLAPDVEWVKRPRVNMSDLGVPHKEAWDTMSPAEMARHLESDHAVGKKPDSQLPRWYLHNARVVDQMKPAAVVYPNTPSDVEAAMSCATAAGVKVFGQCGRHSYIAYCTDNCVLINVYKMKDVKVTVKKKGSSAPAMARLEAGLNLGQAYTLLNDHGYTIPGGTCPTVGLAGLTLGGGKGILTRSDGLLIDKLRGVEAILTNGSFVWANESSHPDLFWLARGGGGNTFPGIATAFHFELVKVPSIVTEWYAEWSMLGEGSKHNNISFGVEAFRLWQEEYVNYPNRNLYVRLEIHPYWENGNSPFISLAFKFLGIGKAQAQDIILPTLARLGMPRNGDGILGGTAGSWKTHSYIEAVQEGGGIGLVNQTGCKFGKDVTPAEKREMMMREKPPFCSYDSEFGLAMKYRALVMKKLGNEGIRALLETVLQAPYFDPNHTSWKFYLQIDPTTGFAGDVAPDATAYPWRGQDEMTMQVIAKWALSTTPFTLTAFNKLVIGTMQPYAGTRSYYNYPDEDMPGGAIPAYSFFGLNALRVWETVEKYGGVKQDGSEWMLHPLRSEQKFGIQGWIPPRAAKEEFQRMATASEVANIDGVSSLM